MLDIKTEKADGVLRIALEGRLDSTSSQDLGRQIENELVDVRCIEFDFDKLDYISSAGLRILASVQKRMRMVGGEGVRVNNASGIVLDTLELTGFLGVVNVE